MSNYEEVMSKFPGFSIEVELNGESFLPTLPQELYAQRNKALMDVSRTLRDLIDAVEEHNDPIDGWKSKRFSDADEVVFRLKKKTW